MIVTRPLLATAALMVSAATACAQSDDEAVTGELTMAPEVETFKPCGTDEPLWLDGDPELLGKLRAEYRERAEAPYSPILPTLVGRRGPVLDCGFCEDYYGSFQVERVVSHKSEPEACP